MSNIRTYRVNHAMQMISIPLHSTTNSYHLGNNREVVDAKGVVQQVTNYYPFGAPYADATAVKNADFQPYKYNGKELDLMHGLNTYDYGARQYDPVLARWDRIDPLCEKYYNVSPYNYCLNNPVMLVDPDGKDPDGWGKTLAVAEMVSGAVIATAGVVTAALGVAAELPTLGGSTVVTVSGGGMTTFGVGLMATGLTTWNMASNDNSYSSSSDISSGSSSVSSSSASNESPDKKDKKKEHKNDAQKQAREDAKKKRKEQPVSEDYVKYKARELEKN